MLYSQDLRKRVMDAVHSGMKKVDVCKTYNVCKQTIYNWIKLEESQGNLLPKTGFQKGHSHGIHQTEKFEKFINEHSDYTQDEIAKHFNVGSSTVGRMLKKLGYVRKKRVKPTQNETKKSEKSSWGK